MTILLWAIILLYAGICVTLIFNNNIWTDEAFTMELLQNPVKGILEGTAGDVHPPLYYLIAKLGQVVFGPSLQVQKLVVILPVILTMMLGAVKVRKRFGDVTALLFIVMLALMPRTLTYAVQPRMYSWALFFITVCGVYIYEVYLENKWQDWVIVTLTAAAAAYSHYFALVSAACMYGFFLLICLFQRRDLLKRWLLMASAAILLYLPWLFVLLKQFSAVSERYWIPAIDGRTILSYVNWAFETDTPYSTYLYVVLFAIAVISLCISCVRYKRTEDTYALWCIMTPLCTTIAGIAVSAIVRPIYYNRYVFPAMGLLCLAFAIAFRYCRKPVLISICVFLCMSAVVEYKDVYHEEYHAARTAATEQFFAKHLGEKDVILYNWRDYGFIYRYYFPAEQLVYVEDMDFAGDYDTLWYMNTYNCTYLSGAVLEEYGLTQEYMGNYGIEHDEFEIYRITKEK